jgi:hypothetical protein
LLALKLLNVRLHLYLVAQLALFRCVITVVNKSLKARIEELADQYIDENEREWVEGKYSVSQRRVLLTKWVG